MKHDVTVKVLFQRSARGLFRALTGSDVAEWLNTELPRVNLPRMDLLCRLKDGRLMNIEFQAANEADLEHRVAVYYLETYRARREYPGQLVLYLGREPLRMRGSIRSPMLQYDVPIIDIGELDGEQIAASGDIGDMTLAILAKVKDRRELIRRVLDRIGTMEASEAKEALEQLITMAGLRGLEMVVVEEVRQHNMPIVVDMMQNRVYRGVYERGEKKGREVGLEEGREEGREKGREEGREEGLERGLERGKIEALTMILTKRFGPLPKSASSRLRKATLAQLDAWIENAIDARSLRDVFRA